jgi:uncharacterized protein (DUF924 family)
VVAFWRAAGRGRWFRADPVFDAHVRAVLGPVHGAAAAGRLDGGWAATPDGALARVLLLDQVPRNLHRGAAAAFATDPAARAAAEEALAAGHDLAIARELQPFLYLPFSHHEDAASQARALRLFQAFVARGGEASYLHSARGRADLIRRFGRFPHRNDALGRPSTLEETELLKLRRPG